MIALVVQLVWVSGARIAALALWIVGLVAVYRWFGTLPGGLAEAGALALSLAIVKAVVSCIGDAADLQTMREVPVALREDPARGNRMWQTALVLRLAAGLAAAAALVLLAPLLARVFLDDPGRAGLLRLAGAAILAELLYRSVFTYLQAQERFLALVGVEAALQASRLALIFAFLLAGATAEAALTGYLLASVVAVVLAAAALPRAALAVRRVSPEDAATALRYMAWILPALLLAALAERADLFLLGALKGAEVAGLYGAILPLALAPDLVGALLAGVLQPKVRAIEADGSYRATAAALLALFAPLAAIAATAVVLFRVEIISLTVGPAYLPVADAFAILLCGTLAWLALTPLALAAVVLSRPRTTLVLSLAQAAGIAAVGVPLVAAFGPVGAAATIALMRVAAGATLFALAWSGAPAARRDTPGLSGAGLGSLR